MKDDLFIEQFRIIQGDLSQAIVMINSLRKRNKCDAAFYTIGGNLQRITDKIEVFIQAKLEDENVSDNRCVDD